MRRMARGMNPWPFVIAAYAVTLVAAAARWRCASCAARARGAERR